MPHFVHGGMERVLGGPVIFWNGPAADIARPCLTRAARPGSR